MRPSARPIGGIRTPSTSVVTILPKAAPMMTPTARSITFPRAMKSRNSFHISPPVARRLNDHAQSKPRQGKSCDRDGGREPESGTDGREEGGEGPAPVWLPPVSADGSYQYFFKPPVKTNPEGSCPPRVLPTT